MIVYVVHGHSGSWDSSDSWVCGIFSSIELAQKCVKELDDKAKQIQKDAPILETDYDYDDMFEHKEYTEYYWKYNRYIDGWETPTIQECELDTMISNEY